MLSLSGTLSEELPVEGPAPEITLEQVSKIIDAMKNRKAAGPTLIVVEMLKASGSAGAMLVRDLIESIVKHGKIPSDWELSIVISLYKGKGAALERGNYRGLKLLDQVLKVLEKVAEGFLRQQVHINDMQFGFMSGRGTTDAIFIVRRLQEKFLSVNKPLYMAFVDLEKAFDRVPRRIIWWAMRKLDVEEWLVRLVQSTYSNARSRVRIGNGLSDEFEVNVGVHQGSCLSPLLFVIILEALSCEYRTGCPWEALYADDLAITAVTLEELLERLVLWKSGLEAKGFRVNMGKTKVMVSGLGLDTLQKSGKDPCAVCLSGTGRGAIFCDGCSSWVHKRCSGLTGGMVYDQNFRCQRCRGEARPIDGRPVVEVAVGEDKLEAVSTFCYLGDTLSAGGGSELAAIARCRSAWSRFRQLLPILETRWLPLTTKGRVYNTCVRSALLYASETWAMSAACLNRLRRNDRAMIRWMCGVSTEDEISSSALLERMKLDDLEDVLRTRRMRWFGHVERSEGWISKVLNVDPGGRRGRGRPRKTWQEDVRKDRVSSVWIMSLPRTGIMGWNST